MDRNAWRPMGDVRNAPEYGKTVNALPSQSGANSGRQVPFVTIDESRA
jgi:hypothetical protein